MIVWRFALRLKDVQVMTEELADALYEAGCDDGSPWSSDWQAFVGFDREADSLEEAIRSAVGNVRRAGCQVDKIEMELDEPAEWLAGVP